MNKDLQYFYAACGYILWWLSRYGHFSICFRKLAEYDNLTCSINAWQVKKLKQRYVKLFQEYVMPRLNSNSPKLKEIKLAMLNILEYGNSAPKITSREYLEKYRDIYWAAAYGYRKEFNMNVVDI